MYIDDCALWEAGYKNSYPLYTHENNKLLKRKQNIQRRVMHRSKPFGDCWIGSTRGKKQSFVSQWVNKGNIVVKIKICRDRLLRRDKVWILKIMNC